MKCMLIFYQSSAKQTLQALESHVQYDVENFINKLHKKNRSHGILINQENPRQVISGTVRHLSSEPSRHDRSSPAL